MMKITNALKEKARAAKSADELIALSKEYGEALSNEQAAKYFAMINGGGEMSDDELNSVAGGGCDANDTVFRPGDRVMFRGAAYCDRKGCNSTCYEVVSVDVKENTAPGDCMATIRCPACGNTYTLASRRLKYN